MDGLIVVDANVVVRALRSKQGASHRIVRGMLNGDVAFALAPAIVLEYEEVLHRPGILGPGSTITGADIDILLDAFCAVCEPVLPWFRFRPFLADPKDDMYVVCALAAGARLIVSDDRHFRHPSLAAFGLHVSHASAFERMLASEGSDR